MSKLSGFPYKGIGYSMGLLLQHLFKIIFTVRSEKK